MKSLSDSMTELSQRAKSAEQHTAAAAKETRDQIEQRISEVKESVATRRDAFRARRAEGQTEAAARWATLRTGVHQHFDQMHMQIDERRDDRVIRVAQRRADRAEANAADAVDFAAYAIEEAEASVLEATEARIIADGLVLQS